MCVVFVGKDDPEGAGCSGGRRGLELVWVCRRGKAEKGCPGGGSCQRFLGSCFRQVLRSPAASCPGWSSNLSLSVYKYHVCAGRVMRLQVRINLCEAGSILSKYFCPSSF